MASKKSKCPMCSTKLKMINGRMTCKSCGYYLRGAENSDSQFGQFQTGNQSGQGEQNNAGSQGGQHSAGNQSGQDKTIYRPVPTQVPIPGKKGGVNPAVIAIPIAASAVLIGIFGYLIQQSLPKPHDIRASQEIPSSETSQNNSGGRITGGYASSKEDESDKVRRPESLFFQQLAEIIWEKDYESVTPQEYASLTALQINREEKSIYYQIDNGDTHPLTYRDASDMDYADLACFTGLEWLSIDDGLDVGDLDGVENLYAVYTENTFEEYARIIPNPEYIHSLWVVEDFFNEDLSGIENFPNLLYLNVAYTSLTDISDLTAFPNLLGLYLEDCDELTDYSPLMTLTKLEELTIESSQLKSIDFIRQMPGLTHLGISDSKINSLEALEACPGLTDLELVDNYEVDDYSIVGSLELLNSLTLELNWGGDLPSFEKLKNLEYLTIKYAGDLSPLKDATSVTYLSLKECSGWELETVASMKELVMLTINDFSSLVDSLEPLTQLPKLEILDLSDTHVFGNVEYLFGIPTLKRLYLDDCQLGLDFDKLPQNDTLEVLSMGSMTILKDPSHNNGEYVSLSEHYDMFSHFPSLTELDVASLQLDSIDFVENLPNLQYLDITNNNVTSLKPLEQLKDFETVWCGKNTILENISTDSDIWVIMSD